MSNHEHEKPVSSENFKAPKTKNQEPRKELVTSKDKNNELTESEKRALNHFLALQKECEFARMDTLQDLGGMGGKEGERFDYELIQAYNQKYCGTYGYKGDLGRWLFVGDRKTTEKREKAMKDVGLSFDNFINIDPDNPRGK